MPESFRPTERAGTAFAKSQGQKPWLFAFLVLEKQMMQNARGRVCALITHRLRLSVFRREAKESEASWEFLLDFEEGVLDRVTDEWWSCLQDLDLDPRELRRVITDAYDEATRQVSESLSSLLRKDLSTVVYEEAQRIDLEALLKPPWKSATSSS